MRPRETTNIFVPSLILFYGSLKFRTRSSALSRDVEYEPGRRRTHSVSSSFRLSYNKGTGALFCSIAVKADGVNAGGDQPAGGLERVRIMAMVDGAAVEVEEVRHIFRSCQAPRLSEI